MVSGINDNQLTNLNTVLFNTVSRYEARSVNYKGNLLGFLLSIMTVKSVCVTCCDRQRDLAASSSETERGFGALAHIPTINNKGNDKSTTGKHW